MHAQPLTGHDGPYDAPLRLGVRRVPPDWIDYNGHMNVAYYTMAFDQAIDRLLEDTLGIGARHVAAARQGPYALQSNYSYLGELLEDAAFEVVAHLVDSDAKRLHLMLEMRTVPDGALAATCEQLVMNVDLTTRRSTPYPDWAARRIARLQSDHAGLARVPQMGQRIAIRRKA